MTELIWLHPDDPPDAFPDPTAALRQPDGLLAAGGDLSIERLLRAYRSGIFPWYEAGQPILWWSPDPRAVLFPGELRISRSLQRTLRRGRFVATADQAFPAVIEACAAPRRGQPGSWITPEMNFAYTRLHELGYAHSVEVWLDAKLAGGIYGVAIGKVFFGESMFSHERDASKVALVYLVKQILAWGFKLIDCQIMSAHLATLGARTIPRNDFLSLIRKWGEETRQPHRWTLQIARSSDTPEIY